MHDGIGRGFRSGGESPQNPGLTGRTTRSIRSRPPSLAGEKHRCWGELILQGPIRENGETVEPREPRPPLQLPSLQSNGELHDPEVQALLRSAEAGERVLAPDVTEEERREIENFDLRNYV